MNNTFVFELSRGVVSSHIGSKYFAKLINQNTFAHFFMYCDDENKLELDEEFVFLFIPYREKCRS